MSNTIESTSVPHKTPEQVPHPLDFPVVGIGASAGGLQALRRFFENMPSDNGMAFVVILHLSPRHESNADKILQRVTRMPVVQVTEQLPIEKNHVYIISPALNLVMSDGHLGVSEADPVQGRHIAIDLFFRTLADVHQQRAYCIVLTGTGTDGSVGMARIKEQGGLTLVQSPDDAEYEEMPRNAIATGQADLILPAAEMPQKLLDIWSNARAIWLPRDIAEQVKVLPPSNDAAEAAAEAALADIVNLLQQRTGHDFQHYKRATVLRRIERRMQVNRVTDLPAYRDHLLQHSEETVALLSDMLIGVTQFFRDREAFDALERDVLPQLFEAADGEVREIRAWSAGCSTGEEPYSLAMLLCEQAELVGRPCKVQLFATDINEQSIAVGRAGIYPLAIITDVAPSRLRNFFSKEHNHYRIKKELREKVLFAVHNLLRDPPFSKLQLISCRNLLIYLDREVQREILRLFHFALVPGGYLFLGSSESADICNELFIPVDKKNRLYRSQTAAAMPRAQPLVKAEALPTLPPAPLEKPGQLHRTAVATLHRQVLDQYAPSSVIVDHDGQIVHLSERAGQFLRYAGGEPSHNLLLLVHPDLRLELRTALYQAMRSGRSVEARRVHLERDEGAAYINMVVRPFRDSQSELFLVLFDEVEDSLDGEGQADGEHGQSRLLKQLEEELQQTQKQLQETIEQAHLSNQELKASNEELQAINEELRSITEEVETSKEELQSINEELLTVNHELKYKVEETDRLNNDLQNLITATDIATVFLDRQMRIKWYTPRASEIFNIIATDAGRSLLDITHHLTYDSLASDAQHTLSSSQALEREVSSLSGHWYIARMVPYHTNDESSDGIGLTFIDITRRRLAEERLHAGQEHMRMVAQSTVDYAILTLDTEGQITSWNRGAELLFGYAAHETLGHSSALLFLPEDRKRNAPAEELQRAREQGRAEDERWQLRQDGTRVYCGSVVTPLLGAVSPTGPQASPVLQGYAKIARDLTRRHRQDLVRRAGLEGAQAPNPRQDEFLAVLSRELRQPLNLIQLNAELLSRLPKVKDTPLAHRAASSIVAAVRTQARVIDDLLDLSRLRTGKLRLNRTPVDLNKLLEGFVESLDSQAHASELSTTLTLPDDEEPVVVDGDLIRIEQIFWNLVSNALKFTPAGGRISLTLSTETDSGMARLDIRDNGQGIDPASLPIVFDLFGQARGRLDRRHPEGLGIGLALVRQLTEAHGGSVQVDSAGVGQGSLFSVRLPLYAPSPEASKGAAGQGVGKLRELRVLMVDDSPEVLEVLRTLLEMEHAQVTSTISGAEALLAAQSNAFDLVLSDIDMPDMDGGELIVALRRLPALSQVPAIALTGHHRAQDIQKALDAGFTQYLNKPVSLEALIELIEQLDVRRQPPPKP
ncbi:MAG: CheR family methyltransferase [Pseudomonas sp.]|uniref:CheR family methyltransferase n=1 Tax=Pseudomonas sp. TaxID=306 RepID=UPI00339A0FAA